ncbi:MAG: DUF1641 domain-containing protein [Deltaproteobacteria bacterium]|nr:DUF1641 domain-containing protein [Deltaproteobacteria bacterium]MBW2053111.1 DUF1641 domain-containing protein [Deltaproteobacteria bacterium]MBW2141444.1 DUF1641 domain-containing protein [Deltaproteobacteria bacterium]MBW2323718.1 DUF1641 domain-containing protein [Deltaproteobacteria bacterium]
MTNEELILERLDRIEAQLAPVSESTRSLNELKEDVTPLLNDAFKVLIRELGDVESAFQLEDLMLLLKRGLRSVRNLTYALQQLENLIDLITTMEPLLKSTVPQIIHYLDSLEQQGVFRTYTAMLGVRAKVAAAYSPEDVEQMGDAFVTLLGMLKKLSNTDTIDFLNHLLEIPADLELDTCKSLGPIGVLTAFSKGEVKDGLGVLIELTKALGRLKPEAKTIEGSSVQSAAH